MISPECQLCPVCQGHECRKCYTCCLECHSDNILATILCVRTEIEELKVRQKASYRELVVDRFEQDVGQIRQVRERRPFDVESSDSDGASDGGSRPGAAMTNLARPLLRPSMASAHAAEAAAFLDAEQALLSGDMPEQTEDNPENPSGRLQAWAEVWWVELLGHKCGSVLGASSSVHNQSRGNAGCGSSASAHHDKLWSDEERKGICHLARSCMVHSVGTQRALRTLEVLVACCDL